jgi:hypothetical protein
LRVDFDRLLVITQAGGGRGRHGVSGRRAVGAHPKLTQTAEAAENKQENKRMMVPHLEVHDPEENTGFN